MNKTKYNQLREEIIKAVPEILELKFGCKVEAKRSVDGKLCRGIIIENYGDCMWAIKNFNDHSQSGLINKEEKIEIIGRSITLEDCLIAIERKNTIFKPFYIKDALKDEKEIEIIRRLLFMWELNKPLQDQSDETINLLWDLIVKK